ncbi:unnamed protein product [Ceutorhynchus assimilis]|uniref:Endosome-associated-trafficking regulator 1 n=1 Tax=Ceutorhynchus assimilis TaxID=467358 RepID=A0A9N9MJ29_9CUCU|nr:unnamed protein product [Ceutorhynchus assimilis]
MSDKIFPKNEENEEPDPRPSSRSLALDLGDDCVHNIETNRLGGAAGAECPSTSGTNTKRDENPFSFKHFLRDPASTSSNNYQSLGARPKVYNNRENRSRQVEPRKINEISSALPDFVQDHLVIEQCYNLDWPNFAQGDPNNEPKLEEPIPLDLPGLSTKSLPDFLTDGPVRTTEPPTTIEPPRCPNCLELTTELANLRQRLNRTEEDVDRNYRRANAAETALARLKQETRSYKDQIRHLQANVGGEDVSLPLQARRLAQELRSAASTAEHSLRSLLTGVDNLRIMASNLENINRIEENPSERFYDDV